jgi:hypothetical protein
MKNVCPIPNTRKPLSISKDHLPWDKGRMLWVCPECGAVNAWNYEDAERASSKLKVPVAVSTGSCFDNRCGGCHANIVHPDSPILAECYTHIPSED